LIFRALAIMHIRKHDRLENTNSECLTHSTRLWCSSGSDQAAENTSSAWLCTVSALQTESALCFPCSPKPVQSVDSLGLSLGLRRFIWLSQAPGWSLPHD
jgi:hypothetical protein